MTALDKLQEKYSAALISELTNEIDNDAFDIEFAKHKERQAEGAAIGVVWLDEQIVLVKRTKLHLGWALLGGTVENGEEFDEAFLREVKEEAGLNIKIQRLLRLENRIYQAEDGRKLQMPLAVFEGNALPGQAIMRTSEAQIEGLEVRAFDKGLPPKQMILDDRAKLDQALQS